MRGDSNPIYTLTVFDDIMASPQVNVKQVFSKGSAIYTNIHILYMHTVVLEYF